MEGDGRLATIRYTRFGVIAPENCNATLSLLQSLIGMDVMQTTSEAIHTGNVPVGIAKLLA